MLFILVLKRNCTNLISVRDIYGKDFKHELY